MNPLKLIYYATLNLLQDEHPKEYKRMGSELTETVNEVLEKVKEYKKKYA